ncbi:MAG: PilZ domain-containing protein [Alphaproteobacteria bacterium]
MSDEQVDKRRHLRHSIKEPCTAFLEDGEYLGSVVNMSVSGAAIHLDVEVDAEIENGAIVELQVQRIGRLRTRAVRSLVGGLAVEFRFDPTEDRALIAKLWKVLNEFSPASGH